MNSESAQDAVLSETQKSTFIESFLSTKSASEINVLRNDEAPRGIFKSILQISSTVDVNKSKEKEKSPEAPVTDFYGPRLPDKPLKAPVAVESDSSSTDSDLDKQLLRKMKKVKKDRDEWVEKDKLKVKKSKKHKKEHKKKHKKHKSKK